MATVTDLGDQGFTTNVTSYTTTVGFTPAVGDLLIVFVATPGSVDATTTLTESAGGGTYTQIGRAVRNTSANSLYGFVRDTLCETATLRNYTWTSTDAATGCIFQVSAVQGIALAGLTAIRQSDTTDNSGAGSTIATVFPGVALAANPVIGSVASGGNPGGFTEPSGFTEMADVGQANPDQGLEVVKLDSGHTSATITWGATNPFTCCALSVEVDATPGSVPPVHKALWI